MITHYFLTSQIDENTSAIEIAEIQRLHLFSKLKVPAKIVTRNRNRGSNRVLQQLIDNHQIINLYQYFTELPNQTEPMPKAEDVLHDFTNIPIENNLGYKDGKLRVRVNEQNGWINNIDYLDPFGFTDRRDLYDFNQRVSSEYFDDHAKLITRVFYQKDGHIVMTEYYRGGPGNQPVLTLIHLRHNGRLWQFDNQDELMGYFLDCLATDDSNATFYSDREDVAIPAFKLMTKPAKRYLILHSIFTQNAKHDGELFPYFQQAIELKDKLSGIIVSTQQEASDIQSRFPMVQTTVIPVSYLDDQLIHQSESFSDRIPGKVIAVARITPLKQLSHIIQAIILVHQHLPFVTLDIYGYENVNDFQEGNKLRQLVKTSGAESYITFKGYVHDLASVYQHADLLTLTSSYEGFAMAILEALGYGCPVLSYDINYGPAEMIQDKHNGELITAGDERELYRRLLHLLTHREILQRYGQNAPASVEKYSASHVQQMWHNFIQNQWMTN